LAIRQDLGRHTILSNEAGVPRGQGGEMAQLKPPAHRVVAPQHDGHDPTPGPQLVESPQPAPPPLPPPGAARLRPADLALPLRDVALGPAHAAVQRRHLLALLGEPLVDGLELAQHAGLAPSGVGRLLPLLAELLLGLLQVALLVAEVGG